MVCSTTHCVASWFQLEIELFHSIPYIHIVLESVCILWSMLYMVFVLECLHSFRLSIFEHVPWKCIQIRNTYENVFFASTNIFVDTFFGRKVSLHCNTIFFSLYSVHGNGIPTHFSIVVKNIANACTTSSLLSSLLHWLLLLLLLLFIAIMLLLKSCTTFCFYLSVRCVTLSTLTFTTISDVKLHWALLFLQYF